MKSFFKKTFVLIALSFILVSAFSPKPVLALGGIENADYILLAPVEGITKGDCNFSDANSRCTTDVATFVKGAFRLVIGVASALAVLLIMFEGLQYIMTANEKNKTKSKERIKEILLGLLLAVSSVLILNLVDPAFTRFKFDLGRANSSTGGASLTSGAPTTPPSPGMTEEERLALSNNLIDRTADAQTSASDRVSTYNEDLQENKDNIEKLKIALDSTSDEETRTLLQNTMDDIQSRVNISENYIVQAAEIKRLTDAGSLTAAEAKIREMRQYSELQTRAWQSNAPAELRDMRELEAAQIQSEGEARSSEAYLYYNAALRRQAEEAARPPQP